MMDSTVLASVVFGCVFVASLAGMALNAFLPAHHRSAASHDAIKLSTGMISVLASLVLGLLVASVKGSFDTTDSQMRSFAANLILLDQTLREWGPDTAKARDLVRDYTARSIQDHWPQEAASGRAFQMENTDSGNVLDAARLAILQLAPSDPMHRDLRESAVKLMDGLLQTRWLLIERAESSIEPIFLVILVAWITLIFLSFGYNAPFNTTVIMSFLICAVALAACLFVIAEMDTPFDGVITISSKAMHSALAHMSQ
jgi:Protein of unknown function (DUF4239)